MRLAIATCADPPVPDKDAELLLPELEKLGVEAELAPWTDITRLWLHYDLVWLSSTWDYHLHLNEFRRWLARVESVTRLENPRGLVDWNLDKGYLRQLAERGVAVIPTIWADPEPEGAARAQQEAIDNGWERVVVKPTVDLGAAHLSLIDPRIIASTIEHEGKPCMVQPYLASLESEGELSLVYYRGRLSHAVRKIPKRGDFRIQEHHGGVYELEPAPPEALELGKLVLPVVGAPLYARIDVVRGPDGELCVIELELIEPSLYLDIAPSAAIERFAKLLAEIGEKEE